MKKEIEGSLGLHNKKITIDFESLSTKFFPLSTLLPSI
jgi:hypothetical protein